MPRRHSGLLWAISSHPTRWTRDQIGSNGFYSEWCSPWWLPDWTNSPAAWLRDASRELLWCSRWSFVLPFSWPSFWTGRAWGIFEIKVLSILNSFCSAIVYQALVRCCLRELLPFSLQFLHQHLGRRSLFPLAIWDHGLCRMKDKIHAPIVWLSR